MFIICPLLLSCRTWLLQRMGEGGGAGLLLVEGQGRKRARFAMGKKEGQRKRGPRKNAFH